MLEAAKPIKRKKVYIGAKIKFKSGFMGRVEKILENSVIVHVDYTPLGCEMFPNDKTVVNHKNYIILD